MAEYNLDETGKKEGPWLLIGFIIIIIPVVIYLWVKEKITRLFNNKK